MTTKPVFSAASRKWRERCDLMLTINDHETKAAFSASTAKLYAFLYALLIGCGGVKGVSHNELLRYMGADTEDERDPVNGRVMIQRTRLQLREDFNMEVSRCPVEPLALRTELGRWFYQVKDYGIFNQKQLLRLLKDNKETLEHIAKNLVPSMRK